MNTHVFIKYQWKDVETKMHITFLFFSLLPDSLFNEEIMANRRKYSLLKLHWNSTVSYYSHFSMPQSNFN